MMDDFHLVTYVDVHRSVHTDSSPEEVTVLEELYGSADEDGVFRGEGV